MRTIVVLGNDQMGQGDPALGRKILGNFLRKSVAMRDLAAIVFFNHGVKLVAAESPVLADLRQLHDNGVEIMPCGTCLEYYKIEPAVSRASNMDEIIRVLSAAEKTITL